MKHFPFLSLLLSSILLCSCNDEQKKNQSATDKLENELNAVRKDLNSDISETGLPSEESITKLQNSIEKARKNSKGDTKVLLSIVEQHTQICINDTSPLLAISDNITQALNYTDIKQPDDLTKKGALIKEYQKVNIGLKNKINQQWFQKMQSAIQGADIAQAKKDQFMKQYEASFKKQLQYLNVIRDTDTELCETITNQHSLLAEHFSTISFSEADLAFQNDEVHHAFNALNEKIYEIAERQVAAQQALMQLKHSPAQ